MNGIGIDRWPEGRRKEREGDQWRRMRRENVRGREEDREGDVVGGWRECFSESVPAGFR